MDLTPFAFIGFCTCVGALLGSALIGLTIVLGLLLLLELTAEDEE